MTSESEVEKVAVFKFFTEHPRVSKKRCLLRDSISLSEKKSLKTLSALLISVVPVAKTTQTGPHAFGKIPTPTLFVQMFVASSGFQTLQKAAAIPDENEIF